MIGRINRRDLVALAALTTTGVGVLLWLSAAAGAIGVPSNDDWVYMRGANSLYRSGVVDMPGHTAASIGQVVLVQPLLWLSVGNPWAFTAFGLSMTALGVMAAYLLARRFVGTGSAVMVVMLMLAFPGFGREAASFMTDVPTCALALWCLLLGARWLQGDGGRMTLAASLAIGLAAISVREFAIAAPAAILIAAWARHRVGQRPMLSVATVLFATGVVGIFAAAASIPGRGALGGADPRQLPFLAPAFMTLAAVLLPAAVVAMGRRLASFSAATILGAALGCLALELPGMPLLGNLWAPSGVAGDELLSGSRGSVIGANAWALSGQLALFASILVAALALRWCQRSVVGVNSPSTAITRAIRVARSHEAPLLLFLAVYAAELALIASIGPPFDRYLYPMVPVAAILLLRWSGQPSPLGRSRAFAHGAFVWLAASAFMIATNSFAYDAARYRGGEAAVAMGYDARTVDAGYEWVGYHADSAGNTGSRRYGLMGYDDRFMTSRPCAVLSSSPLDADGFTLISVDRSAYLQYLFFGPAQPLYLYGARTDGCPALPAAAVVVP